MIIRIKKKIDLNQILIWSNLVIIVCDLLVFLFSESNPYINGATILLSIIIAVENFILLKIEMKKRNPFILLLVFNTIFFYLTRVATLLIIPDIAYALNRGVFPKVNQINYTMIFIILSIIPLAWGLYINPVKSKVVVKHKIYPTMSIKPVIIILLFSFAILSSLFNLFNGSLLSSVFGRLSSFLGFFLTNPVILLIVFTYFISYYNDLSNKQRNTMVILAIIFVVVTIISGSRSGIIQIIFALIFSGLAINNYIELRRKLVLILLIIVIPSSFFAFGLATYIRAAQTLSVNYDQRIVTREGTLVAINDYIHNTDKETIVSLGNVFQRIGFLDMATEMIANKETYEKMINLEYYTKSTIDALSPGFNVYNYPKVSNSLIYLYTNSNFSYVFGADRLSDFGGGYHSDQLTVFGEYYVLFKGYFALIAFLFSGFCFRTIYLFFCKNDSFNYNLMRSFLLYVFYNFWLNSFGMDWMVTYIVYFGIVLIACIILLNLSTKIKLRGTKVHIPVSQSRPSGDH